MRTGDRLYHPIDRDEHPLRELWLEVLADQADIEGCWPVMKVYADGNTQYDVWPDAAVKRLICIQKMPTELIAIIEHGTREARWTQSDGTAGHDRIVARLQLCHLEPSIYRERLPAPDA